MELKSYDEDIEEPYHNGWASWTICDFGPEFKV